MQKLISQSCVNAVNKIVCGRTDQCDMLTTIGKTVHRRGGPVCTSTPSTHSTRAIHLLERHVSCVVVAVIPQGGGLSVCRCRNPAYPLSPTRCWRYRFSYLDFGGDCGLGRCKRPAEARCLPRCQSPRLGSRRLNPLLNSHIQTENDFPLWKKCWRKFVLKSHRKAKLEGNLGPQTDRSACQRSKEHGGPAGS